MTLDQRQTARSEGMAVHPLKTRAFYLKGYDLAPDVVFDVGSFEGTSWLYNAFPAARFVLVEPQGDLTKNGPATYDFFETALGARDGQATLTIPETAPGKGRAMSSLRIRRDALAQTFRSISTRTVPVTTLDRIAADYDGRFGLKIDTEGYEAEVLEGAAEMLHRTDFVILELSLTARFDGVAAPSRVINRLAKAGLELRDVLRVSDGAGKRAKPRHIDAMFTRWNAA